MTEAAALELRLEATMAKFQRQVDRAQKAFDRSAAKIEGRSGRLDNRLQKVGSKMGQGLEKRLLAVASAAGAALAIRQLGRAARNAAADMAALGDAADRASFDPGKFEALKAAITLDGQDANGLEKGLITLSRRIVEAEQGSQTAVRAFRDLGVNIEEIRASGGGSAEVLAAVADGMAKSDDATKALNASMVLFGRAGGTMNAVLKKGSAALEDQYAEAEDLGLLYGGSLLRNAQEVNAELDRQSKILDVSLNKAFINLAPILSDAIGLFADLSGWIGAAYQSLREFIGLADAPIEIQVNRAQDELVRLGGQFEAAVGRAEALGITVERRGETSLTPGPRVSLGSGAYSNAINGMGESARAAVDEILQLDGAITQATASAEELVEQQRQAKAAIGEALSDSPPDPGSNRPRGGGGRSRASQADGEAQRLLAQMNDRLRTLREEAQMVGQSERNQAALAAAFERERIERELLTIAQREGAELTAAHAEQAREMAAAIEEQTLAIFDHEAALDAQADAARKAEDRQRALADEVSTVSDRMVGAISSANSWADALRRVGVILAELALQGAAGQGPLGGVFNSLLGVASNGVFGLFGGSAAPATSPLPPIKPSFLGNVFRNGQIIPHAKGGVMSRPAAFPMHGAIGTIAEKGAEVIAPLKKGPDGSMGVQVHGGQAGGGGITYAPTYNINGQNTVTPEDLARAQARDRRNFDTTLQQNRIRGF